MEKLQPRLTPMSSKESIKNNILDFECVRIQTSPISEAFAFVELEQGEPMNPIESELNAIERTENIREFNEEVGIVSN